MKTADISTSKSNDKQEKIDEKELLNPKNLVKEESSFKKEIDNDSNTLTSKEKNIVTIDLTNDEKIVYSQLGINPLIKLGKEYLTSNNFVYLKENSKEKEITLDNKDTIKVKQVKKTLKTKEHKEVTINIEENETSNDEATKKTNENEEVVFLEHKEGIEVTDEINNTRKKGEDLQQVLNKIPEVVMDEVGLDEVGKGAVLTSFSAVVVLTEKNKLILKNLGVMDSKKLTPKKKIPFPKILLLSSDYGIGQSSVREIDKPVLDLQLNFQ